MSEKGKLIVQVYTGMRALPISGACVSVLGREQDGSRQLEAFRRTGPDGLTRMIEADAPDSSISLDELSDEQAYRAVDILVDYPGYFSAFIEGAQIFAGQTSRQEVKLVPLTEEMLNAGEGGSFTYSIPPQKL